MSEHQPSAAPIGALDSIALLGDANLLLATDPALAMTYCGQVLDALALDPDSASLRAQAIIQSADAALKLGQVDLALSHLDAAMELPPVWELQARALRIRGQSLLAKGDMDAAYRYIGQAVQSADHAGQLDILAEALNLRAQIEHRRGESIPALVTLEEVRRLRATLNDVAGEIRTACNGALILIALAKHTEALELLHWSLERLPDSATPLASELHVHSNLGMLLEGMGQYEEAAVHYMHARQSAQMTGDLPAYATLSLNAGEIARKLGHPNASDLLEAARREALELHLPHVTSAALHSLGLLHTDQGNGVEAERCLAHAEEIAHTIGDIDTQLDAMLGRAKNWLSTAHYRLAMPKLEEALHLAGTNDRPQAAFDAHMLLAGAYETDDPRGSLHHLKLANELERELRDLALAKQAQNLANDALLNSARLEAEHERQLRTISEQARSEAEAKVQAQMQELERGRLHDGVTGLPNRLLLRALLGQEIREESAFSLVVVDFDRFRGMMDVLGLMDGDDLLRQVATRLEGLAAVGDTLARLSSDVFAVIMKGDQDLAVIRRRAAQLLGAFNAEFSVGGAEVVIGATVGVARFPDHGIDPDDLLRLASQAASEAKDGAGVVVAAAQVVGQTGRSVALSLESGLARALERNEFELHFQPLVDAVSGRPVSGEALLRWNSAALGRRSPAEFIPLLERSGLIVPVGDWVLHEACRQAAPWGDVRVAVNLSARQFMGGDLVDTVSRALKESGLAPERLELEITESLMMQSPERAVRLLSDLKRTGVRVMLDDFGTGFSNLSYLHAFPLDGLKIDRSFVVALDHGERAGGIIEAIVQMGHRLGLEIVAEGIETEEQHRTLQKLGVPILQGYLFGRPQLNWHPHPHA
ncbi:EAL domain-containing protein [Deinococcus sp. KSM4-11]|uniref:EAL domain-containing protein n=1 Tax=Deinococcus sp. KSM4-11 TaxID=2568654 RepID=UPI0010A47E0C|nr:EAL domain-containing protein [Deinococcus sp. KSM4-11]THF86974.1 EAL domain-containing protein [Deinococcus sp. KSM4-11]